jgi:lysophospholipase L1-like esterase
MWRAVCSVVIVALALIALDIVVGGLVRGSDLPDRVADIQHPTTLIAKLDRLHMASGPKIVIVGDSLVYGGILAENGDSDWRAHGLGEQLATEIGDQTGCRPFVMNLGIDGALPADLEYLVPLVVACDVDWLVFDIHLRPFSSDFSAADRQMSRPWLRELSADPDGRIRWRPGDGAGGWLSGRLADHSAIARSRGLIQDNMLSTRAARRPVLRPVEPQSDTDTEVQSLVKLAQLKNRLKTLDIEPSAPQVSALERVLRGLADRRQRHVVFYAKENPDLLPDVMDAAEHAASYELIACLVRDRQGPTGVFVPPMPELQPEHFIDFTHLNADGYRLLAHRLAAAIR